MFNYLMDYLKWSVRLEIRLRTKQFYNYDNVDLFKDKNCGVIFIHIPKAAGMSFVNSLYGVEYSNHARALDYIKQDSSRFFEQFSFTATRDPSSRLESAFNYLNSGGMSAIDEVWRRKYLSKYESLHSFVLEGGLDKAVEEKAHHFIPQYEFIYSKKNELLVDFVGKIEDVSTICRKVEFITGNAFNLSRYNVAKKTDFKNSDFGFDFKKKVYQVYQSDFEFLNYD